MEWPHHPAGRRYGYDPYTNSFVLLPPGYGYGFRVGYGWNPPYQHHQGHMQNFSPYSSSSSLPLGRRPPLAAAQRGRGRGRGRHNRMRQPYHHGGPGLLGSDPSSQRPPQLPPPRRGDAPGEPSSSQPPAQVQVPVPPPENKDPTPPPPPAASSSSSSSPSSRAMSDPVKGPHGGVDVSMTAAAMSVDSQGDVVVVGVSGSSTAARDKKRLLPLDPPAPVKSSDADVSMAHCRDDHQAGDVLGLSSYMAQKRLIIPTKASSLAADTDGEEEAKAAARNKKTRLGWGQGLAKFENQYKKVDENSHKLVAHDGATGEAASSHGSSPPAGNKGHGDNDSLKDNDMAEMRVSQVTTAPALFSKGISRPITGDLSDPGKNGSISSSEHPAKVRAGFSGKHSPSYVESKAHGDNNSLNDEMAEVRVPQVTTAPALFSDSKGTSRPITGDLNDLGKNGSISSKSPAKVSAGFSSKHIPPPTGGILFRGSILPKVSALSHKSSSPPEDTSISSYSSRAAIAVSKFGASSSGNDAPDESSMKFTKAQEIAPRMEKVIVKMVQRPRKIKKMNVLSDEEPGTNENDAAPLVPEIATVTATKNYERMNAEAEAVNKPVNQICHDSKANLPDKGHGESSMDAQELVTGKVLVGESKSSVPSPLGMRSSQAACLTINFNEHNSSNEAVCITKSSSKLKENVAQSVLTANHGNQGNCVGQDTLIITFFPDEISAKIANGTYKDDQVRSGSFNDKVKGKEMEKVLCVSSNHGSGIQLSCEMNSEKEMEKVDSIPCPERNDLNADMENPTKGSSSCVPTNASVVREPLRASEAMKTNSEKDDANVKSKETDLNEPPLEISDEDEAPKTYDLPSSSGYAALDIVEAQSSHVPMDIDLNIPLDDVTPLDAVSIIDLGNSSSDSEATDSDATIMEIGPSQITTTAVTQTAQQPPANQPGSMMLFGRVICQVSSTGTTNHTPNQTNQTVVPSSNMPSNPVVSSVTRQTGRGQVVYPSSASTSVWRGGVPNNQIGQQAVLSNMMLYGGSTNGASSSTASPLQPGTAGSRALVNMVSQQRQQALANITPYNLLRGGVPAVPSSPHLMQGSSSGGAGMGGNFGAFNSVPQQWPYPVIDTSVRLMVGLPPFYYPGATANQAPAAGAVNNGEGTSTSNTRAPANAMQTIGTNNGEGASTSTDIRAPANTVLSIGPNNGEGASRNNNRAPAAPLVGGRGRGGGRGGGRGRGRGRGSPISWLSLWPQ